jgi:cell division septum initiation protein DivIVA
MFDELLKDPSRWFRTRFRGYDRRQVDAEFRLVDQELAVAIADRDSALSRAESLAAQLDEARAELHEYHQLHSGHTRQDPVAGCIRYLIHSAKKEAARIEQDARSHADEIVQKSESLLAARANLLDEAEQEAQRRLASATEQARQIVVSALHESKRLLDELTDRQRLLDDWLKEITANPDVPLPRPTPEGRAAHAAQQ